MKWSSRRQVLFACFGASGPLCVGTGRMIILAILDVCGILLPNHSIVITSVVDIDNATFLFHGCEGVFACKMGGRHAARVVID